MTTTINAQEVANRGQVTITTETTHITLVAGDTTTTFALAELRNGNYREVFGRDEQGQSVSIQYSRAISSTIDWTAGTESPEVVTDMVTMFIYGTGTLKFEVRVTEPKGQVIETPAFITEYAREPFEQKVSEELQERINALDYKVLEHLYLLKQAYLLAHSAETFTSTSEVKEREDRLKIHVWKERSSEMFRWLNLTFPEDLFSPDEILNIFTYNYRFNV